MKQSWSVTLLTHFLRRLNILLSNDQLNLIIKGSTESHCQHVSYYRNYYQ